MFSIAKFREIKNIPFKKKIWVFEEIFWLLEMLDYNLSCWFISYWYEQQMGSTDSLAEKGWIGKIPSPNDICTIVSYRLPKAVPLLVQCAMVWTNSWDLIFIFLFFMKENDKSRESQLYEREHNVLFYYSIFHPSGKINESQFIQILFSGFWCGI